MIDPLDPSDYRDLIRQALLEDVGFGDLTTRAIVPADAQAGAVLLAKSSCVLAGLNVARDVFTTVDARVQVTPARHDGGACESGDVIARVTGPTGALLTAERTALNFLQHLSGIATSTRAFVDAAGGTLTVLDTRKTVPVFRALAKYAVRCGGGTNHRTGLYDGILIKDNHIRAAGGIAEAVRHVRATGTPMLIEVETQSLAEVDEAVAVKADIIMLDNFDDETIRRAVRLVAGRARVELSGNMTVERVRRLADSGADCVSIGAITHSAPAADISLEMDPSDRPRA